MHKKDPHTLDYKWEVPSYILQFCSHMSQDSNCIYGTLWVREDGSIIKEEGFPDIVNHPERATIISPEMAMETAKEYGLTGRAQRVELSYSNAEDKILYVVENVEKDNGLQISYKTYWIDAHTGRIVAKIKSEAIR